MIRGYRERAKAVVRKIVRRAKPLEHFLGLPAEQHEQELNTLFDAQWYLAQYPDVAQSGLNPLVHYLRSGATERRNPCPLFDTDWYLTQYPDIAQSGHNPLVHYLHYGAREGRDPCPLFDSDWYLARYPDVAQSGLNPLAHYLCFGAREGYDPCPLFDTDWYLAQNPDVAESGLNPLEHYLQSGAREGRDPCPLFDTDWYLAQYPDVAQSGMNPLFHYIKSGAGEERIPNKQDADFILNRLLKDSDITAAARLFEVMDPASLAGTRTRTVIGELKDTFGVASHEGRILANRHQIEAISQNWAASHFHPTEEAYSTSRAYVSPYIAELDDVKVYPGSMLILNSAGDALHEELHSSSREFNMQPKMPEMKLLPDHRLLFRFLDKSYPTIDRGLHLCVESDWNYFHWVTEILPRLFVAEQLGIDREFPALVTSRLHENLYELMDLVRHPGRPVMKLDHPHLYRVRKLIYPSPVSRILDIYDATPSHDTTYLPTGLLKLMVQSIRRAAGVTFGAPKRRLYLRRRSGYRHLVNQREIELSLVKRGFELVDLTGVSARSQIELFSQAELVVGPTGAAFTNLIWCQPSTKALVLFSDHPYSNMTFWDDLAKVADLDISYLFGPRTYAITTKNSVHDDFSINVRVIEDRVDELLRQVA